MSKPIFKKSCRAEEDEEEEEEEEEEKEEDNGIGIYNFTLYMNNTLFEILQLSDLQ